MTNSISAIYSNSDIKMLVSQYYCDPMRMNLDVEVIFWALCHHPDTTDFYKTYHDRVVDTSCLEYFKQEARFVRPMLTTVAAFVLFRNQHNKPVTTHARSYGAIVLELDELERNNQGAGTSIFSILEDLEKFAPIPSFGREILDVTGIHNRICIAFKQRQEARQLPPPDRLLATRQFIQENGTLLSVLHILILLVEYSAKEMRLQTAIHTSEMAEDPLLYLKSTENLAVSLEGKAFLYRWVRFPVNNKFLKSLLSPRQLGGFRKKYLSLDVSEEIRSIAERCIVLTQCENLTNNTGNNQQALKTLLEVIGKHPSAFETVLTKFPDVEQFINLIPLLKKHVTLSPGKWVNSYRPAIDQSALKNQIEQVQSFAPPLHLLYRLYYNVTQDLMKLRKTASNQQLFNQCFANNSFPLPLPDAFHSMFVEDTAFEEMEVFEEETVSSKGAAAGADSDAKGSPQKIESNESPAAAPPKGAAGAGSKKPSRKMKGDGMQAAGAGSGSKKQQKIKEDGKDAAAAAAEEVPDQEEQVDTKPAAAVGAGAGAKKPSQKIQGNGMQAAAAAAAGAVFVVPVADDGKGAFTPVVAKKVVDPLKHIPLVRDFPLKPLAYDARVHAHFQQLAASGKSYSAASHDIQVHAFSSLVDGYVGTVYSLPDKWTNTQTGKQDTRYRLPAQITLPGQKPRDVIFRYTQGADGVWYHRDMTYRDENNVWYAVEFPKLENGQKGKTWSLTHEKGTETYDPSTETITIEAEGHTIVLFRVR